MSAGAEFYFSKGYTPIVRSVAVSGLDTFTIAAPGTSNRVVLTNISFSSNAAGTIAFYFEGNDLIAQYFRQASATVTPQIGAWESTILSGRIFGRLGGVSGTDGCYVNAEGFFIPQI